jgi:hypothetical protein
MSFTPVAMPFREEDAEKLDNCQFAKWLIDITQFF